MKKNIVAFLLVIFGLIAVVSCSSDGSPSVNFHISYLVADSVDVPETMIRGERYPITIYYKKPDNCHYFNGLYRSDDGNSVTVAVEAMVLDNVTCEPSQSVTADVATFDYLVPLSSYTTCKFKFYNGATSNGLDSFLIKEVPVVQ